MQLTSNNPTHQVSSLSHAGYHRFKKAVSHSLSGLLLICSVLTTTSAQADQVSVTTHASWADILIANVTPENNEYGSSPSYIDWQGYDGADSYASRNKCATFVSHVLKHSYQWDNSDFYNWFGSTSPNSARYHDTIVAENGFTRITQMDEIKPGDILASKYASGSSSGHVMIAKSSPTPRTASKPIIANTTQYEIEVMDSSSSHHGENDTRKMPDGTWDQGVGAGVMRLYADNNGDVIGYTWSTSKYSTYYDLDSSRHIVVGRLGQASE